MRAAGPPAPGTPLPGARALRRNAANLGNLALTTFGAC
jgi:hypothetical protein